MRRFRAHIDSAVGRYRARYIGRVDTAEYVVIASRETEILDVELTTSAEGLYAVGVHLIGSVSGQPVDRMLSIPQLEIAFFDRASDYQVVRSDNRIMSYSEYIAEMATYNEDLKRY
jgi:hypothetical protein